MKFLIVVDMQNDFIDGVLGSAEARSIIDNVKKKIQQYKENGDVVVYTADTHGDDYLSTKEGQKLPIPHCIQNTDGWKIHEALGVDYSKDLIISKYTFGVTNISDLLASAYYEFMEDNPDFKNGGEAHTAEVDCIEFIGVCTDICVISNALIAASTFKAPIVVDASCCAGTTPENHQAALKVLKSCLVDVINEE